MQSFYSQIQDLDWAELSHEIEHKTTRDVQRALDMREFDLEGVKALLSPAADGYLEAMATRSHRYTQQRFGKTIQFFAPMYLSNECQNICTYCGFSLTNKMPRRTLTDKEIHTEMQHLKGLQFDHILLVTGEANKIVGVPYLKKAIQIAKQYFAHVSIEVQPLEIDEYAELKAEGLHGVYVYQETYHKETYKEYHPKGKKSNFEYRLDTPERIGAVGMQKIGIGFLMGLENWRVEAYITAMHLAYLRKRFWKSTFSISFPRLRPHAGETAPNFEVTDRQLVQVMTVYRLFDHDVEISLSTRERQTFRDYAIKLGVTTMSAGSKTNPGGYVVEPQSLEQFEIEDSRSITEMTEVVHLNGYEPVLKNWDNTYA